MHFTINFKDGDGRTRIQIHCKWSQSLKFTIAIMRMRGKKFSSGRLFMLMIALLDLDLFDSVVKQRTLV